MPVSYVKYRQPPNHMHQRKSHLDYIYPSFMLEARYVSELLTDQSLPKELIIVPGEEVSMYRNVWMDWERR